MFVLFVMQSYLIEVRGLKQKVPGHSRQYLMSYLIEVRGLKQRPGCARRKNMAVVSYRGTWIETSQRDLPNGRTGSYLIEVRGLKPGYCILRF